MMLFKTYRTKKNIGKIKDEVSQLRSMAEELLNNAMREEQEDIIEKERKLEEAKQVYDKYKMRIEDLERKINAIEEELPPRRGLNRLRYLNPWILVFIVIVIAAILFALMQEKSSGKTLQSPHAYLIPYHVLEIFS
jgi:hypothetical protein